MTFEKSKQQKASFIRRHKQQVTEALNEHPDLIKQAGTFQKKISKTVERKGIKNLTKADICKAGGVGLLNNATCGKQYGSITITVGGDGSFVVGGNVSGGFALGLVDECEGGQDGEDGIDQDTDFRIMWLTTTNVSGGASAGVDASINIGFWNARYDKLHGFAHGIVGGGSIHLVGANGSGWWAINWAGKKDEFVGISLGYQGGLSAELEYNWGYTFQKGTFNACKNVKVEAINNTGREIKVIDVDYYDYNKKLWRSEPTKNTKIANNEKYTERFNLNQVDHSQTKIRIEYRVKNSGVGWSNIHRTKSSKSVCEEGDTYTLTLTSK